MKIVFPPYHLFILSTDSTRKPNYTDLKLMKKIGKAALWTSACISPKNDAWKGTYEM